MTDARALRDDEHGTIDRRKLLKIGAWAAPALLVATAVPAATASGTNEPTPNTVSRPSVVPSQPQVGSSAPNRVDLWYASIFYDYNQWGLTGQNAQNDGPQSLTVTFRVRLTRTDGTFVADVIPQETVTIAKYGTVARNGSLPGVPAGNYLVVSEIISNVFNPSVVNGVTFASPPSSASTPITIS